MSPTITALTVAVLFLSAPPARAGGDEEDRQPALTVPTAKVAPVDKPRKGLSETREEGASGGLKEFVKSLDSLPPGDGEEKVAGAARILGEKVSGMPPEDREAYIKAHLDDLNGVVAALRPGEAPPEVMKRIHSGASALNNSAGNWRDGRGFADKALSYDPNDKDALVEATTFARL